jgi:hypothetical protein
MPNLTRFSLLATLRGYVNCFRRNHDSELLDGKTATGSRFGCYSHLTPKIVEETVETAETPPPQEEPES